MRRPSVRLAVMRLRKAPDQSNAFSLSDGQRPGELQHRAFIRLGGQSGSTG